MGGFSYSWTNGKILSPSLDIYISIKITDFSKRKWIKKWKTTENRRNITFSICTQINKPNPKLSAFLNNSLLSKIPSRPGKVYPDSKIRIC